MSTVIYDNKIDELDSLSITSTLGLSASGDLTKLRTRSPADQFTFTNILAGNDITITLEKTSGLLTMDSIVVMYTSSQFIIPSKINLYNGATDLGLATPTPVKKYRLINGVVRNDWIFIYDSAKIIDKIEVIYESASSIEETIGLIAVMKSKDIRIAPKTFNDNPIDISNKKRSQGGQVFSTKNPILESYKFSTTPDMEYTDVFGLTSSTNEINQLSGIAEPIFIILENNDNMNLYCTMDKLISRKIIEGKNTADDWLWQCAFSVTEEL
jgi:hypothetical protein